MNLLDSSICIIVAAGNSVRISSSISASSKVLVNLQSGKTVLEHSLDNFIRSGISNFILVVNDKIQNQIKTILDTYKNINCECVLGGKTRFESVANAIRMINQNRKYDEFSTLIIHDGARPNCKPENIKNALKVFFENEYDGLVFGNLCANTIKVVDSEKNILKTLDRNTLSEVQTPQIFKRKALIDSMNSLKNKVSNKELEIFDDSMILELSNYKVRLYESDKTNIKITTSEDIDLLNYLIKK